MKVRDDETISDRRVPSCLMVSVVEAISGSDHRESSTIYGVNPTSWVPIAKLQPVANSD